MRLLLVFTALFILAGHSFAGKTGELKIYVKDPLGAPVVSAKVELGDRSMLTDYYGVVIFDEVVRKKYFELKISSDNSIYVTRETTAYLEKGTEVIDHILNWTKAHWEIELSVFREEIVVTRQEIFNTTDYSNYAACDDTTGEHHYLEAVFPGGYQMLQSYIGSTVIYPEQSIDMDEQGKVYISFVIEGDGQISDIQVEKGVSHDLDREAKRCIQEMPSWLPGLCNGSPIRTRAQLPIVFRLE